MQSANYRNVQIHVEVKILEMIHIYEGVEYDPFRSSLYSAGMKNELVREIKPFRRTKHFTYVVHPWKLPTAINLRSC